MNKQSSFKNNLTYTIHRDYNPGSVFSILGLQNPGILLHTCWLSSAASWSTKVSTPGTTVDVIDKQFSSQYIQFTTVQCIQCLVQLYSGVCRWHLQWP